MNMRLDSGVKDASAAQRNSLTKKNAQRFSESKMIQRSAAARRCAKRGSRTMRKRMNMRLDSGVKDASEAQRNLPKYQTKCNNPFPVRSHPPDGEGH